MSALHEYIDKHAAMTQGEGEGVDLIFFHVRVEDEPKAEDLVKLIEEHRGEFNKLTPLDGHEYSYLELGGWVGDQGYALRLMGLGDALGIWKLHTPRSIFGNFLTEESVMQMAGAGLITVSAKKEAP